MIKSKNQTPIYEVYEKGEIDQRMEAIVDHSHNVVEVRIDTLNTAIENNAAAIILLQDRATDLERVVSPLGDVVRKNSIEKNADGHRQVVTDFQLKGVVGDTATFNMNVSDVGEESYRDSYDVLHPGTNGKVLPKEDATSIKVVGGLSISADGIGVKIDTPNLVHRYGNESIEGEKTFLDSAFFEKDVSVYGDESVDGSISVLGEATIGGDTSVGGALTVAESVSVGDDLTVEDDVTIKGTMDVSGDVLLKGELQIPDKDRDTQIPQSPVDLRKSVVATEAQVARVIHDSFPKDPPAATQLNDGSKVVNSITTSKWLQIYDNTVDGAADPTLAPTKETEKTDGPTKYAGGAFFDVKTHDVIDRVRGENDFYIGSKTLDVKAYDKVPLPNTPGDTSTDVYFEIPTSDSDSGWRTPTSDHRYPTEKLTKDTFDTKVDKDSFLPPSTPMQSVIQDVTLSKVMESASYVNRNRMDVDLYKLQVLDKTSALYKIAFDSIDKTIRFDVTDRALPSESNVSVTVDQDMLDNVVHKTYNEVINGIKTFTSHPIVPAKSGVISDALGVAKDTEYATEAQVRDMLNNVVHTTGNEVIRGNKTFLDAVIVDNVYNTRQLGDDGAIIRAKVASNEIQIGNNQDKLELRTGRITEDTQGQKHLKVEVKDLPTEYVAYLSDVDYDMSQAVKKAAFTPVDNGRKQSISQISVTDPEYNKIAVSVTSDKIDADEVLSYDPVTGKRKITVTPDQIVEPLFTLEAVGELILAGTKDKIVIDGYNKVNKAAFPPARNGRQQALVEMDYNLTDVDEVTITQHSTEVTGVAPSPLTEDVKIRGTGGIHIDQIDSDEYGIDGREFVMKNFSRDTNGYVIGDITLGLTGPNELGIRKTALATDSVSPTRIYDVAIKTVGDIDMTGSVDQDGNVSLEISGDKKLNKSVFGSGDHEASIVQDLYVEQGSDLYNVNLKSKVMDALAETRNDYVMPISSSDQTMKVIVTPRTSSSPGRLDITVDQIKLDDVVHKAGDETISGVKTFTDKIVVDEVENSSGFNMIRRNATDDVEIGCEDQSTLIKTDGLRVPVEVSDGNGGRKNDELALFSEAANFPIGHPKDDPNCQTPGEYAPVAIRDAAGNWTFEWRPVDYR